MMILMYLYLPFYFVRIESNTFSSFLSPSYFCTGVKAGGDRQELHELIRVYSMEAGAVVKGQGKPNDLLDRIRKDPNFAAVHSELDTMIDPSKFIGRAAVQVDEFLEEEINPILLANQDLLNIENVDAVNV